MRICCLRRAARSSCRVARGTAAAAAQLDSPNILLITLDTMRADRMGFLGSTRGLTPALDALRADGDRLHARLRAGADHDRVARDDPHRHAIRRFIASTTSARRCRRPCRICPQLLRDAGYRTGGVRRIADPRSAQRDRARIRSRLRRLRRRASGFAGRVTIATGRSNGAATKSSARALALVSPAARPDAASFLWVHLFDRARSRTIRRPI